MAQPTNPSSQPSSTFIALLKESLELSSFHGDLTQSQSTLQTWTSIRSLPPPTPIDLNSALNTAVTYGHVSIVRLLLEHGALIATSTVIHATRDDKPNLLAIFEAFLDHGWSVSSAVRKDGPMAMW